MYLALWAMVSVKAPQSSLEGAPDPAGCFDMLDPFLLRVGTDLSCLQAEAAVQFWFPVRHRPLTIVRQRTRLFFIELGEWR